MLRLAEIWWSFAVIIFTSQNLFISQFVPQDDSAPQQLILTLGVTIITMDALQNKIGHRNNACSVYKFAGIVQYRHIFDATDK